LSEVKTAERAEARRLRQAEGLSVREITRRLRVSKSSVSLWVRDLPLTAEQRARLEAENALHGRQLRGAAENARKSRLARIRWQDEGRDRARNGDPLFAAGCMLYWGEGRKTRNAAQITNSDPEVLRFSSLS